MRRPPRNLTTFRDDLHDEWESEVFQDFVRFVGVLAAFCILGVLANCIG